jgi:hypothetical protein
MSFSHICKFLQPQMLLQIFVMTQDTFYKHLAESKLGVSVYSLPQLLSDNYNALFSNGLFIIHHNNLITIIDAFDNTFELIVQDHTIQLNYMKIDKLGTWKKSLEKFEQMFLEFHLGSYALHKENAHVLCILRNNAVLILHMKHNRLAFYNRNGVHLVL